MMRGTPEHPKFADLQSRLAVPKYRVAGILELLWHFTAKYSPDGGVGKWPDVSISRALEWEGDPAVLVRALTDSGWLEAMEDCRLYVHDWHEHADDAIQRQMSRHIRFFANGARPKFTRLNASERPKIEAEYGRQAPVVRTRAPMGAHLSTMCAPPAASSQQPAASSQIQKAEDPDQMSPIPPALAELPAAPLAEASAGAAAMNGATPPGDSDAAPKPAAPVEPPKPKRPPSEEAQALGARFGEYMAACHPTATAPLTEPQRLKWAAEFDKALRGKGARRPPDIREVIDWLQTVNPSRAYSFVVQSPTSLLSKFDRIRVEMTRRAPAANGSKAKPGANRAQTPTMESWLRMEAKHKAAQAEIAARRAERAERGDQDDQADWA